jgi:hypothetical protein
MSTRVILVRMWSQKTLFELGSVFSWLKYGKATAATSRVVVLFDMAFGVKFHYENVDGISNEALTRH